MPFLPAMTGNVFLLTTYKDGDDWGMVYDSALPIYNCISIWDDYTIMIMRVSISYDIFLGYLRLACNMVPSKMVPLPPDEETGTG